MPHPLLIDSVQTVPAFRELAAGLPRAGEAVVASGLAGSAPLLLVAGLHRARPERMWLVVGGGPEDAEMATSDLEALLGEASVFLYPQRESLPYEEGEPHLEIGGTRVEALEALLSGRASLLVTTPRALQELAPAVEGLDDLRLEIRTGEEVLLTELAARLEGMGFDRVPTVEAVGQFALRGGIVDVFGFGAPEPARIEFFGDSVESIRYFDILTQLSVRSVEELQLLPVDLRAQRPEGSRPAARATEGTERRSLMDYLPSDALMVHLAGGGTWGELERTWSEVRRLHTAETQRGNHPEPPENLFLPAETAARRLQGFAQLFVDDTGDLPTDSTTRFRALPPEAIDRDMGRLGDVLRGAAARGEQTLILCDNQGQLERLQELLDELRIARQVELGIGSIAGGFVLADSEPPLRLLTDHEIFRRSRRVRRRRRFRGGAALESIAALKPGEYVVHMDHGVGQFRRMERVRVGEEEFETLVIEYAGGELLRVPVHRVDLIERWVSDADEANAAPKVHRIGGKDWSRQKQRTKKAIEEMTAELLELYAARAAEKGFAFAADTRWQREMESAFLFEDTPDQRQATEDVKRDMESPRPMDRLICGDVGYGKTEIAIRAAFKAVQDGRQVAVLVPTTILAEQHMHTFSERLADFPVRIEALSRFRTAKEQSEVLRRLEAGEVDVVVGTHRILSPDVKFRELGLIIVDEEQRFGVKHKELLKQLRRTVDVLTLTATPIPRTLHFSMLGLRDMTLIQTPPRDRQPVITHVLPWTDAIIEDAMRRELDRGGQVFFVHNRVETIDTVAQRVQRLVPEARIAIAHGQMKEKELEAVMTAFLDGERDILVATAIIESGLDVPRANTLIVNRADHFGLSQLYQIRGRVGRSHHRAFCYLLIPDEIQEDAEKRLRVLEHYTELGSGYRIALKDLELRGAGNILGSQQSGFVHAVGLDTYMRLLDDTIKQLKGGGKDVSTLLADVSVDGAALIPDDYVPDEAQKLNFYRRLSRVETVEAADAIRRELRDRFGPVPAEVETLLSTAQLRLLGGELGMERILVRPWDVRINFRRGNVPRMASLQSAFASHQLAVEVRRPTPLSLALTRHGTEPILPTLVAAIRDLASEVAKAA
ncbi:MAG: Transcription-repair coupling factor [uncultured Gemmatimonadetes bacterium]|uniref:Transcription-repair-coupling factor n=1 Tax=uncultured Gemmatimonadota bacterium TaxID=203437 RepID=A0A6J4KMI8_9BACT|nr:MAG: Transcription-repair coupling factor [uncultured Gemmatimonadota bacterium]